jgi:hypothetical protein
MDIHCLVAYLGRDAGMGIEGAWVFVANGAY